MSAALKLDRTNTYPGRCCICGAGVPSQRGYLLKGSDVDDPKLTQLKWLTLCTTKQCAEKLVGEAAVAEADRRALLADGRVVMPADDETLALRRAIGLWDAAAKCWRASPLLRDRDHVLRIAEQLGLDVDPSWLTYEDPAPVRAAVERARAVPSIREYQVAGIRWLAYRGLTDGASEDADKQYGGVLGDEPGCGKTIQTLLSLHDDEALVVVCPANAKAVWVREANKWRPDRFDTITTCDGEGSFRWPENPRELVIINYDVLPFTPEQIADEKRELLAERFGAKPNPDGKTKLEKAGQRGLIVEIVDVANRYSRLVHRERGLSTSGRHRAYLLLCEWVRLSDRAHKNRRGLITNANRRAAEKPPCPALLVFDEVHYAENNKALRTERCRYLAGRARRIYGLTGTPVDNEPLKLWGLFQTCRALPFSWGVFKDQFNVFDGPWGGIDFLRHAPRPGSTARGPVRVKPGTTEILQRTMLRRRKEDVLGELPPVIFSEIPIAISGKLAQECDELATVYADYIMRGELPPFEAVAGVRKLLAEACIPAMLEFVENYETNETPLLVFSAHRKPVETLAKRKGWFAITGDVSATKRGEIEDQFQGDTKNNYAGAKGHGVAGTSAMATAMTLTRASTVLQVDPFWKHSDNEQAYKRADRIGQKNTVHVIRLVPDHVLVQHVADLLTGKAQFVDDVLNGAVEVVVPPSRFNTVDNDAWQAAVTAKAAEDKARDEAAEKRRRDRAERELAKVVEREGKRVTPKTSEARARVRYERLAAEDKTRAFAKPGEAPVDVVQSALQFMLSVCDGARDKDNQGFNAPDSAVARWLAPGVQAGTEYAVASMTEILRHYPRQLREQFPALFTDFVGGVELPSVEVD